MAHPIPYRTHEAVRYHLVAWAFEFCVTFIWFTVLPFGFLTEFLRKRYPQDNAFNYQISIYQYYFLPLVGLLKYATAVAVATGVYALTNSAIYAALLGTATYLIASGGIHLDGWLDTIDGLYAYGKDRYTVMREPHVGALGVIWLVFYMLLFIPTLGFDLYDLLTAPTYWPKVLALSVAFIASKINCFYVLQYALRRNKMRQDAPMTLEPAYYFHHTPITHTTTYIIVYALGIATLLATLLLWTPSDAPLLISWFTLITLLTMALNNAITKPIIKELEFANGDLFGALICLFELVYIILYTLLFVRMES